MLAIVLSPDEAEAIRRPGLKALARLASYDRRTLLEIGDFLAGLRGDGGLTLVVVRFVASWVRVFGLGVGTGVAPSCKLSGG